MPSIVVRAAAKMSHQNSCQSRFSVAYLVIEDFQDRECEEMLAVSLSLYRHVSRFGGVSGKSGALLLLLAVFAQKCHGSSVRACNVRRATLQGSNLYGVYYYGQTPICGFSHQFLRVFCSFL